MIALDGVSKGYGGQQLLQDCTWRIGRGERIGLVGPNGAGKTTLCRVLALVEETDAGRVHRDTGVTVGYLPQEVTTGEDRTVLAEALAASTRSGASRASSRRSRPAWQAPAPTPD
ncbi:MAG TPA: ATP-binding cassette domain-containing protein [Methylomirabilota bacterium]|nr:ATP-binding cassette domain-containing protein [Methylomirabilota bacterium]